MNERDEGTTDRQRGATRVVDRWVGWIAIAVINVLALFSLVALLWATIGVGIELYHVIVELKFTLVSDLIISILTVFILMEVVTVSVGYLRASRIDVRDLVDVTFAIIFREIWVGLFSHELGAAEIAALALLILALAVLRYFVRSKALHIGDMRIADAADEG